MDNQTCRTLPKSTFQREGTFSVISAHQILTPDPPHTRTPPRIMASYQPLSTDELPVEPPQYEPNGDLPPAMEEFEIDQEAVPENFLIRARRAQQKLRDNLTNNIVLPVSQMLDPVFQWYATLGARFDAFLSRLGNPLILKRLIYVMMVGIFVYILTSASIIRSTKTDLYIGDFTDHTKLGELIDTNIDVKSMEEHLHYLSSMPHMAGSAGDLSMAMYVEQVMRHHGISEQEFYRVDTFVNYPNTSLLEIFDKSGRSVLKKESAKDSGSSVPFNADSFPGYVKAPLVFANYGTHQDMEALKGVDVDVDGCIVLIKYGEIPAFEKIEIASNYNAVGVLFMSDPENGPTDSKMTEFESVGLSNRVPGDLLSPGFTSDSNTRVSLDQASSSPRIPSLPVSAEDASSLLKQLEGIGSSDVFSGQWSGDASSPAVAFENSPAVKERKTIWNVVGKIEGREQDSEGVIIGAARDSWCFGATHSGTGTTVLLQLIQLFDRLKKEYNWTPLRSIFFVSFDGTEYNLAGASEWVESRYRELRRRSYMYIDLSDAVSGDFISVKSHPALLKIVQESMKQVQDPVSESSIYEAQWKGQSASLFDEYKNYVPFMSVGGMPALELSFKAEKRVPHTCEDTFERLQKVDPDMKRHKALTQLIARVATRFIDEPIIPFDMAHYVEQLNVYTHDLESYSKFVSDTATLDFNPLVQSILRLKQLDERVFSGWNKAWWDIVNSNGGLEPTIIAVSRWGWNSALSQFDKNLLTMAGLPDRPWYKNMVFGPQYWTPSHDFQCFTFPGVRDAIFNKDWETAQRQIDVAAKVIQNAVDSVKMHGG